MLVGSYDGGVDEVKRLWRPFAQRLENPQPDPCLGPSVVAVVDRRVGAIPLRQIPPRRPGPQDIDAPIHDTSVLNPRHAAQTVRKPRLNHRSRPISIVKPHHPNATNVLPL